MSLDCGGYGVALVWLGSKEPKTPQRRVMLSGRESSVQAMSEEKISSIIETLDGVSPSTNLSVGLFGVFPASTECVSSCTQPARGIVSTTSLLSDLSVKNGFIQLRKLSQSPCYGNNDPEAEAERMRRKNNVAVLEKLKWRLGLTFLEPSLYESMPIPSREGRHLIHYWIEYLGPLMIPTERIDNPFTSIIVPLALQAPEDQRHTSGRKALLYSVYSLAAFSQSSCVSFKERRETGLALGPKYLHLAFKQLGRSLIKANHQEPEAVLATILTLTVIGIFTDNYSDYRVHIRGGVCWIRSIDKLTWRRNHDASTIYQIFACIETLRPAHRLLARDLEPQELSLEGYSFEQTNKAETLSKESGFLPEHDPSLRDTAYYCLDQVFSLTKPILECIIQINRIIFDNVVPADGEFVALEFKIMANNPESLHFPGLNAIAEKLSHNHACIWHCATYAYYKCSLLRLPPTSVQWLVRQSIEHLEAIELLAADLNESGLLWPVFIVGCEAQEEDLRASIDKYFDKRETLGIVNVPTARRVVSEVWKRRDQGDPDVSWYEIMAKLGIDILLS